MSTLAKQQLEPAISGGRKHDIGSALGEEETNLDNNDQLQ
jgi:hypothetical protein